MAGSREASRVVMGDTLRSSIVKMALRGREGLGTVKGIVHFS